MDADGTITQGGYFTYIVADDDFVLRVPESIRRSAQPLLRRDRLVVAGPVARQHVEAEVRFRVPPD